MVGRTWWKYGAHAWVIVMSALFVTACSFPDPAPPDFVGAATVRDEGTVELHLVSCSGGNLRVVAVELVTSETGREQLWAAKIEGGSGVAVAAGQELSVQVGKAPNGLHDTASLRRPLPADQELQAVVNYTSQPDASTGFTFRLGDLRPGTFHDSSGANVSLPDFEQSVKETCRL
jgi:hypothetical protein